MKKLFTLALMALMGVSAWADTSTLTFTKACGGTGTADDNAAWTITSDGTESSFDSNKGIHYGTGKAAVGYIKLSTNSITETITSIKVNASTANNVTASVDVTVGGSAFGGDAKSLTNAAADYEFTGSASGEIVVNVAKPASANGALYVKSIVVTYTSGSDNRTATSIEFSGNYATKFTYGANGESCALPSATVKAGETPIDAIVTWEVTKGADFVVGDAEPVIEGNAVKPSNHSYGKLTLKASFAGDTQNKPSSKSYDLMVYKGYMKISEILTDFQKENTKFTSTGIPVSYWCMADETTAGTATVTYVNGSNTYINDGTNDLLLYGSSLGLEKGDVISCDKGNDQGFDGIYGTMKQYSGLLEFVISAADMKFTIKSQGATVTPKTIDVADLGAIANMNAYLKIENAEYVSADNKNLTFKVGEASFIVRQNWTNVSIDGLEATAKYTLEGMGAVYKTSTATTYQLYLTSWTKTGEPTAINEVKANTLQNGAVYNVAGQKVNAGYKGLVIKNGKKVVNK